MVAGADPGGGGGGGGGGGQLPPPRLVYMTSCCPGPRPYYYIICAQTRARTRALSISCAAAPTANNVFPGSDSSLYNMHYQVVPWLHDGAYLAQRLLAQGCSLISSSRDRSYACRVSLSYSSGNLDECCSGNKDLRHFSGITHQFNDFLSKSNKKAQCS